MAASRRLFFALWPPAAVADGLHEAAHVAHRVCGGRVMRRETLHVTLAFLGEVPESAIDAAESAAGSLVGKSFDLRLDHLAYWKHNRILWAGCSNLPPALAALADGLARALRADGFHLDERPFAAHVTLLRDARCPPELPALAGPLQWHVGEFALVESRPSSAGPHYEPLRRWPLAAAID